MSEPEYKGFDWNAIDREGLAKAALLAGLKPETLLPSITSAPIPPVAKPVYDGDLNPDEVAALNPFLVKEMKTRGKVSAVDCLNSLIWVKRKNCFWTRFGYLPSSEQSGPSVAGATIHPSGVGSRQCETSVFERTPSVRPCHPTTH